MQTVIARTIIIIITAINLPLLGVSTQKMGCSATNARINTWPLTEDAICLSNSMTFIAMSYLLTEGDVTDAISSII
jgi:hypothetical protein